MAYQGSCHCGAVTVDVDTDVPTEAISCNCSHCRRKGFLLTFVPRDKVTVTGEEALGEYVSTSESSPTASASRAGPSLLPKGQVPMARAR